MGIDFGRHFFPVFARFLLVYVFPVLNQVWTEPKATFHFLILLGLFFSSRNALQRSTREVLAVVGLWYGILLACWRTSIVLISLIDSSFPVLAKWAVSCWGGGVKSKFLSKLASR